MSFNFSKGPSAAPEPTRVSDNLRSEDQVEILLGLGEGPWSKLHAGLKSFYIANTPLMASDGTLNFPDAQLTFHKGSAMPDPIKFALGGSASGNSVGVNLAQDEPVTRTTKSGEIDAIDVRLRIDQLLENTEEGDQLNTDMVFKIEVKPTSSGTWAAIPSNTGWTQNWINPQDPSGNVQGFFGTLSGRISELQAINNFSQSQAQIQAWEEFTTNVEGPIDVSLGVENYSESIRIYGRTQSPVLKEIRVPVARLTNDTYDVRVTKISAESTSTVIKEITWDTFEEITIEENAYPNTAMAQLLVTASDQLSNIPQMYGVYDTAEILVPSIFDPETRSYDFSAGPWDGTFKVAFTDDLAWIIYDLVHNDTHGIAAFYAINFSKYEALEASIYWNACNPVTGAYVGVPRPTSGVRPRATFNGVITTPRNSMELLTYMAGAGNAVFYEDVEGNFRLKVEQDTPATQTFNNMDVENGRFQYSFTDVNTRYNDITVVYRNKLLPAYEEDRRRVFDQGDIDAFGQKPLTFVAVGCVDTDEAIARAYHKLATSLTETRQISFNTSRFGAYVEPHDIIMISDEAMDEGQSRRCMGIAEDGKTMALNEPLALESGVSDYVCRIQTMNGIAEYNVDHVNSTVSKLKLTKDVDTEGLDKNFSFSIASLSRGDIRPYRVTSVEEVDGTEKVKISAIEVNRAKYDLVDNFDGTSFNVVEEVDTTLVESTRVTNLAATTTERVTSNGRVRDINLTWEAPVSPLAGGRYVVRYSFNGGQETELYRGSQQQYELLDARIGSHIFSVTAMQTDGSESPQISRVRATLVAPFYGLPSITGVSIQNKKDTDTSYIGKNATLEWSVDTSERWEGWESDLPHPDFSAYSVDIVDSGTGSILNTYEGTDWNPKGVEILNEDLLGYGISDPRSYSVVVSVTNDEGNEGASFTKLVEKPSPILTGVSITQPESFLSQGVFQYDIVEDSDFLGVTVWISPNEEDLGNQVWSGLGSPLLTLFEGDNYITYVAVDILGNGTPSKLHYVANLTSIQDTIDDINSDIEDLVGTFGLSASAADLREEGVRVALEAARNSRDATIATRNWGFEEGATGWGTSEDLAITVTTPVRMDEGEVKEVDTLATTDYKEQGLSLIKELITAQKVF